MCSWKFILHIEGITLTKDLVPFVFFNSDSQGTDHLITQLETICLMKKMNFEMKNEV